MAPNDSTVVELIFNSGHSKSTFRKSAQIVTNDSTQERVSVSFGGKIFVDPDSIRPLAFSPMKAEFHKNESRKKIVNMTNHGDKTINITALTSVPSMVGMKIKDDEIKPGKTGKIELEWYGGFGENDSTMSITFMMADKDTLKTRFTIPLVVLGTNPKPKPPEKLKQQAATQQNTISSSKPKTPQAPAPGTQKQPYPEIWNTKFDSTKAAKVDTLKAPNPQNK